MVWQKDSSVYGTVTFRSNGTASQVDSIAREPHRYSWRVQDETLIVGSVFPAATPVGLRHMLAAFFCGFRGGTVSLDSNDASTMLLSEISSDRFVIRRPESSEFNLILTRIPE
ncbi:hypothetical protein [Caulifigura coniformis]|nr:hypothetical protein [Caulifigura coniformis]